MNNEIKEILFLLHNDRLTDSGKRKLEDYITNLQEENKQLKEELKRVKFILSGHWEEYEKGDEKSDRLE